VAQLILRSCAGALIVLFGTATAARAQTGAYISVGVDYGIDTPVSDDLGDTKGFGVSFRIPRPDAWSAAWDFGSVSSTLSRSFAGTPTALGSLSVRPLMAGAAYTVRAGRVEVTGALMVGVSLVGFEMDETGREGVRQAFGAPGAEVESGVALAVQPKLVAWFDLNGRFGLTATASYLRTRPELSIETGRTTLERFRVKADTVRMSAGIVVKVY
jgi:hypothetical protein